MDGPAGGDRVAFIGKDHIGGEACLGGISRCLGRRSLRVVIRSEKRCRNLYASLTEVLVYDSD